MKILLLTSLGVIGLIVLSFLVYYFSVIQMVAWIRTFNLVTKTKEQLDEEQIQRTGC